MFDVQMKSGMKATVIGVACAAVVLSLWLYGFIGMRRQRENWTAKTLAPAIHFVESFQREHGRLPTVVQFQEWASSHWDGPAVRFSPVHDGQGYTLGVRTGARDWEYHSESGSFVTDF